jgi:predicted DNA-binding transcriptional regulator YafY
MSTYTIVQDAIKTKQQLVATYHGQQRVMYPFALVPHPVPWTLVNARTERFRGIPR